VPDLRPVDALAGAPGHHGHVFMNGRLFDPRRADGRARLDATELWQVEACTMDHPSTCIPGISR
jgi:hypothetical protein